MNPRPVILVAVLLAAGFAAGQFRSRSGPSSNAEGAGHFVRIEGGLIVNEDEIRTARETASHSSGYLSGYGKPLADVSEEEPFPMM